MTKGNIRAQDGAAGRGELKLNHRRNVPALYLHGGPGLSALPERLRLGESLGISWWDQPRPAPDSTRPFAELVEAAHGEFTRRAIECGGKLGLLANSFGAQIALRLANRDPQRIAYITLLAPVRDLQTAFIRLARRLARDRAPAGELLSMAETLARQPDDRERFWQLIAAILATPDFLDAYWSPRAIEQRSWMAALIGDSAVFDFNAFQSIVNDFLNEPPRIGPTLFTGPVSLVLGAHDSLNDNDAEGKAWKAHFPQAELRVVDAGHFPHLERPTDEWYCGMRDREA